MAAARSPEGVEPYPSRSPEVLPLETQQQHPPSRGHATGKLTTLVLLVRGFLDSATVGDPEVMVGSGCVGPGSVYASKQHKLLRDGVCLLNLSRLA